MNFNYKKDEVYSVPQCKIIQIELLRHVLGVSGDLETPVDDGEWLWE